MTADSAHLTTLPPELTTGTWTIDPVHSLASFAVRHAGVSTVRGTVGITNGDIVVGDNLKHSSVRATLDAASVDTRAAQRDSHLRSTEFFDVDHFPTWSFVSTDVFPGPQGRYVVRGELTIHGQTRFTDLETTFEGVGDDIAGHEIAGFTATARITRHDFGLEWAGRSRAGNAIVGDTIAVQLDVTAVRQV
ncbi:MAG: YceI family protein [Bifidobacteriaceae bacterium]|jgi:polyisoprenoid-binding protein YceI|nr:YceI family protein [Bifidobacteriaceae bacterium]